MSANHPDIRWDPSWSVGRNVCVIQPARDLYLLPGDLYKNWNMDHALSSPLRYQFPADNLPTGASNNIIIIISVYFYPRGSDVSHTGIVIVFLESNSSNSFR